MEFVFKVWIGRKKKVGSCDWNLVHNRDALKGRPRMLRTVKPLFSLPTGSTLRP